MQNGEAIASEGAEAKARLFFISRAGPDNAIAQRVAHILEDAGRRVLIQDWDFKNRAFMERMHAALTSGARTIALLSPEYLQRDHCAAEWQNTIADDPLNKQSRLIVLRIRPCDPVGLLKSLAYWDLVPLLAPEHDGLLRDAVLASVRMGREAGHYAGVWWLRAEKSKDAGTWDGIEQGLADLQATLFPGTDSLKDRAEAARSTLRFLSSGGFEKPWLLVALRQCGRQRCAGCLAAARQCARARHLAA
jgi:hypothetical protein